MTGSPGQGIWMRVVRLHPVYKVDRIPCAVFTLFTCSYPHRIPSIAASAVVDDDDDYYRR